MSKVSDKYEDIELLLIRTINEKEDHMELNGHLGISRIWNKSLNITRLIIQ